jgi:uncharacterized protein YecA (UPF0149 family)
MLFFLATPESSIIETKTSKIRVHLSSGVAEIFENHQDLMGKIDNDFIEFETNFDNKSEVGKYLLHLGVFVVSTKNSIIKEPQSTETAVYVYAKRVFEISSKNKSSLDSISKEYEIKRILLEEEEQKEAEKVEQKPEVTPKITTYSNLFLLKEEVNFLKKIINVMKEIK